MLARHAGWLLGVRPAPCVEAPGRERTAAIGHPTVRIVMGVGAALLLTVGMGVAMALDLQRTWAASADSVERGARSPPCAPDRIEGLSRHVPRPLVRQPPQPLPTSLPTSLAGPPAVQSALEVSGRAEAMSHRPVTL